MTVMTDRTEQLSQELDKWHKQQASNCSDRETAELLQLAMVIKQAAGQEGPPPEMVSRIVDQLVTNPGRVSGKRRWLQAALAGTAAALFLVAAQLSPQGLDPSNSKEQAQLPVQPPPVENQLALMPPMTISPLPAEKGEAVVPPPATAAEPKAVGKAAPPQPTMPPIASKPAPAAVTGGSGIETGKQSESGIGNKRQWAALVLPGHQADSIIREAGMIRQVYNAGKEDEIVITQQETGDASPAMRQAKTSLSTAAAQAETDMATAKAKTKSNKITVTVKGREVVVEGNRSQEDLKQIAGQLMEDKQPEVEQTP